MTLNLLKTLIKKNKRRTNCFWWNSEYDKLIRLRKAAYAKLKFKFTRENFLKYKQTDAKTKYGIRRIKKESFISFCESLDNNSSIKFLWQRIKVMSKKFNHKDNSNKYLPEKLNRILESIETLCPPWVEVKAPEFSNPHAAFFFNEPFFLEELKQ